MSESAKSPAAEMTTTTCKDCICPQTCDMFDRCILKPINDHHPDAEDANEHALAH